MLVAVSLLGVQVAAAQTPASLVETVRQIDAQLGAQHPNNAQDVLAVADPEHRRHPHLLYRESMVHFMLGRYQQALAVMDRALAASADGDPEWQGMRELLAETLEVNSRLLEERSTDERFVVRYAPGADRYLVPYALQVLSAADGVLSAFFGQRVPGPIRLEIYPTPADLARVSSLTVADIERTGTIALSKWNRLMIASPRALVRGYPWMDTIAHEFVHLVLGYVSRNQAPVWLQEGIAKLLEQSWRTGAAELQLHPASKGILAAALRDDKLLAFEQLHPSIALLDSQNEAALAFAQVATFMHFFVERAGAGAIRSAVSAIARGVDAKRAFADVVSIPWKRLESLWRERLEESSASGSTAPRKLALRFRRGEGPVDESSDVLVKRARRHLRLGDLLWERGRVLAASLQYDKALAHAPDNPIIASRLARCSLAAEDPVRAERAVSKVIARHPDHAPSQALLGAARLAKGDRVGARDALKAAIRLNPFDPQPHCDLARVADSEQERGLEARACAGLGGR